MEQVTNVYVKYVPSDTIRMQGTYEKASMYMKQGYNVQDNRNGNQVLTKPAQVNVTLVTPNCTKSFNMKDTVISYYGKDRISQKLVDTFENDIKSGKITFEMSDDGSYYNMI